MLEILRQIFSFSVSDRFKITEWIDLLFIFDFIFGLGELADLG